MKLNMTNFLSILIYFQLNQTHPSINAQTLTPTTSYQTKPTKCPTEVCARKFRANQVVDIPPFHKPCP